MALVLWGAERFTEGAVGTALRFQLSTFYVGAVVSGFEPENLVTGIAAALGHLHQIALGTVIGSAVFMLTGGLGVALLLTPMIRAGVVHHEGIAAAPCADPCANPQRGCRDPRPLARKLSGIVQRGSAHEWREEKRGCV
jgi:hypothetical protein